MQIKVHYHGIDQTEWTDQFIKGRISKLNKYLSPSASIHINLQMENQLYVTTLAIHNLQHDYAYTGEGANLYESFQSAIDKGARGLREYKRMLKNRIHRKISDLESGITA
jgi:ribosomal subunit interface protein